MGPAQHGAGPVEFGQDVGAEMKGKLDIVLGVDLIRDLESARGPVQPDQAAMPGRRTQ